MSTSCIHVTSLPFRIEAINRNVHRSRVYGPFLPADKTAVQPKQISEMVWKTSKLNKGSCIIDFPHGSINKISYLVIHFMKMSTLRDRGSLLFLVSETRGTSARNRTILWSRHRPRPGTNKLKNQLLTSLKRVLNLRMADVSQNAGWKHLLGLESARAALCKWATCTRQTFLSKTLANSVETAVCC